ncbi:phage major capsid protein [Streptomyces sp. NPDC001530]|uniref:phage major capsid protein n=1 Tax=Streptomyces sp. NPDC001530 TaxID=3364582 RepID=UPI0036CCA178
MSEFIKRLQERRLNVWEQTKELLDTAEGEKRELTADEEQTYQRLSADLDKIDERVKDMVEAEQRTKDAEAAFAGLLDKPIEGRQGPTDRQSELRKWAQGETAQRSFEVRPDATTPNDFRALSKLTAAAGANTVPISFYNQLIQHMIENSGLLQTNPTLLRTATGEQIQVPKTTAHSTPSGAPVAEAGNLGATPYDPTFGQVPLDAYKYGFLLQVSHELLNDTAVDLEGYLAMQAGRALGNWFGSHLIIGTGSSQPNGVVTAATSGVTGATVAQGAAVIGAFIGDNLIDLFYSVIAPYRNSSSCAWLMRDATVAVARKLKDTTGQYIWAPGLQAGSPDTILGKPLYTDPNVAAVGSATKSVLFGDFSQYFVRQVETLRFERSDDYAFNTDLATFRVILRGDGDLVDTTGAIKYLTGNTA